MELIRTLAHTDVLLAMHGAALTNAMFLKVPGRAA